MSIRGNLLVRAAACVLLAFAALWLAVAESPAGNQEATAKLPRPVVNSHVLMERFHEPLYEQLHEALQQEPADRNAWRAVEQNAIRLAEVANLTAIREVKPEQHGEWLRLSGESQQPAMDLAAAARGRDLQKARGSWRAVIESCNACHQKFAPEKAPMLEP